MAHALQPQLWPHLNCGLVVKALSADPAFRPEHLQQNQLALHTLWRNALLSLIVFYRRLMEFEFMDNPYFVVLVKDSDDIEIDATDAQTDESAVDPDNDSLKKRVLAAIMSLLDLKTENVHAGQLLLDACNTIAKAKIEMSTWPEQYRYFIHLFRTWVDGGHHDVDHDAFRHFREQCKQARMAPFKILRASDDVVYEFMCYHDVNMMQAKFDRDLPRLTELLREDAEYENLDEFLRPFREFRNLGNFRYEIDEVIAYANQTGPAQPVVNVVLNHPMDNCNTMYARLLNLQDFITFNTHNFTFANFQVRVIKTLVTYVAHLTTFNTYDRVFSLHEPHEINAEDGARIVRGQSLQEYLIDTAVSVTTYEKHTQDVNQKLEKACDVIRDVHRKLSKVREKHARFAEHHDAYRKQLITIREFRMACKEDGMAPFFLLESSDAHLRDVDATFDAEHIAYPTSDDGMYLARIAFTAERLLPIWKKHS